MSDIQGDVGAGFEAVRDAFAENFDKHGDVGAAFTLYHRGQKVVDIWGGVADVATGRPWAEDSLQLVFSTTKGATAVCANLLVQRGELDLDAPVVNYWPEFGAAGKENIPVRWLLSHRSGLPVVDVSPTPEEVLAWDPIVKLLAEQAPVWEPGTAHGYHALTYGWLVGEVVRRISGKSLGTFFADEVAAPLGLDFWIGLPASQEPRVSPLIQGDAFAVADSGIDLEALPPEMREIAEAFLNPDSFVNRAVRHQAATRVQQPRGARGRDPRRQRHHRRPFAGAHVCGPDRRRRRRRPPVHRRHGRRRHHRAVRRSRQGALRTDPLRARASS